jgi:hypothetical protein
MEQIPKICGDLKPSLIDLEGGGTSTGRKSDLNIQRERLSERGIMYCVYWIRRKTHSDISLEGYVGISKNFKERMRSHKKNRNKTPLTDAIQSIGWFNLIKEIIVNNISLEEALLIELKLRPMENIGWNLQKGGNIGVDSSWYDLSYNRVKHSDATSTGTKLGISNKDTKEQRSARAKRNWVNNRESYKSVSVGSNNPRAILNEDEVHFIRYTLIPNRMTDKEIAVHFDVKRYVINFIRINKNWKHV